MSNTCGWCGAPLVEGMVAVAHANINGRCVVFVLPDETCARCGTDDISPRHATRVKDGDVTLTFCSPLHAAAYIAGGRR